MTRRLKALTTAATVTYCAAPLVRRLLLRVGVLDIPNHRSSHTTTVPRGGGIAALAGVSAGILAAGSDKSSLRSFAPVAILSAVGYLDDVTTQRGGLPASARMATQIAVGAFADKGTLRQQVTGSLVLPGVVNVFNFMDGINGISALTSIVWGLNAQSASSQETQFIGALTAGAASGFLPWNAPTAKLFLGDTGSYLFGGLIALGILRSRGNRGRLVEQVRVAAPLFPYVADAAQAIVARRLRHEQLTEAHRDHVYQRLVDTTSYSHLHVASVHAITAIAVAATWHKLKPAPAVATTAGILVTYLGSPRLHSLLRTTSRNTRAATKQIPSTNAISR